MNKVFLSVLLGLLLTACGDTQLDTLDHGELSWQQQRGQWVFINYWAQWCHPCRKEIPELNQFARQYQGHAMVLGVNFDGPAQAELRQQTKAMDIEFVQLIGDPAARLGYERPTVLPATYVFDPSGVYHGVMVGPQTEASLSAWLQDRPEVAVPAAGQEN